MAAVTIQYCISSIQTEHDFDFQARKYLEIQYNVWGILPGIIFVFYFQFL